MKDRAKVVVPKPVRSKIITELHRAHLGISKTYAMARQMYYWPLRASHSGVPSMPSRQTVVFLSYSTRVHLYTL